MTDMNVNSIGDVRETSHLQPKAEPAQGQKKKLLLLGGLVILIGGLGMKLFWAPQQRDVVDVAGSSADKVVVPPPRVEPMPALPAQIQELVNIGKDKSMLEINIAKAEKQLVMNRLNQKLEGKAEEGHSNEAFLLAGEAPANPMVVDRPGRGVAIEEQGRTIDQLAIRYISTIEGRVMAYVSTGDHSTIAKAEVGAVINGITITSVTPNRVCANQGKISRCVSGINMPLRAGEGSNE